MSPEESVTRSVDDERAILEARARTLARARPAEVEAERRALLTFNQGSERYALDARSVQGVFRLRHLTPLPGAPPELAGVTSWRGHLLTVLDLARVLGLERSGLDDRVWVVVAAASGNRFGLLAGELGDFVRVPESSIQGREEGGSPFAVGTTRDAVLVLDAERLAGTLKGGAP